MTLPAGFAVRLAPGVRVREGGRTLIGGAPTRLVRLSPRAAELLAEGILVADGGAAGLLADRLLDSGLAEPVLDLLPAVSAADLTVVVPVRGRAQPLDRLLRALGGAIRVVVVDDASPDPVPLQRVATAHGADLLRLPDHAGPAAARNAGRRKATTPIVCFVDSDVVVTAAELVLLARHLADPSVAAVAPRIGPLPADAGWLADYEADHSALDLGPASGLVRPLSTIGWVPSACLVVRTATVGEFDESMSVGEDVDLVWRLDAAGLRVRYEASVVARHEHRTTVLPWLRRRVFYGSSAAALAARHGTAVSPAVLTPAGAVLVTAVLVQRRWSVPVAAGAIGWTARRLHAQTASCDERLARTAELTAIGVAATARQASGLVLRHAWPVTAALAVRSGRARRAALIAATVATVADARLHAPRPVSLGHATAHRLDDLTYGLGLWAGAWRARSVRAVVPWVRRR